MLTSMPYMNYKKINVFFFCIIKKRQRKTHTNFLTVFSTFYFHFFPDKYDTRIIRAPYWEFFSSFRSVFICRSSVSIYKLTATILLDSVSFHFISFLYVSCVKCTHFWCMMRKALELLFVFRKEFSRLIMMAFLQLCINAHGTKSAVHSPVCKTVADF